MQPNDQQHFQLVLHNPTLEARSVTAPTEVGTLQLNIEQVPSSDSLVTMDTEPDLEVRVRGVSGRYQGAKETRLRSRKLDAVLDIGEEVCSPEKASQLRDVFWRHRMCLPWRRMNWAR